MESFKVRSKTAPRACRRDGSEVSKRRKQEKGEFGHVSALKRQLIKSKDRASVSERHPSY